MMALGWNHLQYRSLTWIVLLFIVGGWPFTGQAKEWQRVHSKYGYYSVSMPGKPKFSKTSTPSPVGRIPEEICEYQDSRLNLTAEVSKLPGIAVFFGGSKTILSKASQAYLKHEKGTLTSSRKLTLQGYPGKEILYQAKTKAGRAVIGTARFYLVQKNLYVLVANTYNDNPDHTGAKEFLDSFTLENLPKKKPRALHPIPASRPGD